MFREDVTVSVEGFDPEENPKFDPDNTEHIDQILNVWGNAVNSIAWDATNHIGPMIIK